MPYYHVDNNLNKAQSVNDDLDWLIIVHFCELIDNNKD